MKIAFINPYCLDPRLQDYDIKVPPIGLYYLASALMEKGHHCNILNWYSMKGRTEAIEQELRSLDPDIIAISILHANRWGGIDIAKIAKKLRPNRPVVFGGPGATFLWEHLLKHFREIDTIILGEGEETIVELIETLERKGLNQLNKIAGIAFRDGDTPVKAPPRPFIQNLDMLPDPSRFFSFQHVISSRGCPWNCSFCGSPKIWQRTVRFHSAEYFVKQLQRLYEQGQNFFFVSDDTFTLKKQRVISICQKIINKNLKIEWAAISRVNIVDEEILYWMRKAGCIQISYGVESGSAKIRKILNKNISDNDIQKAFELTTAYGIMPRAYFIYGNPGESQTTINQSVKLIKRIRPLGAIFYILDIFPGTKLYEDFKKRTGQNDDLWLKRIEDIMYFETDPKLDKKKILKYGKTLRKAFYSNLPRFASDITLKDLPELAPYHAAFLARLGLTFAFGDYSKIDQIPQKLETAATLFQKALSFFPNKMAYLGLAIIYQRSGNNSVAIEVAKDGLKHFPSSSELIGCLGVSLMNLGQIQEALNLFMKNDPSLQNLRYALKCAQILGNKKLALEISSRIKQYEQTGPSQNS